MKNDNITPITEKLLNVLQSSGLTLDEQKKAVWRAETAVVKEIKAETEDKPVAKKKAKGKSKKKK